MSNVSFLRLPEHPSIPDILNEHYKNNPCFCDQWQDPSFFIMHRSCCCFPSLDKLSLGQQENHPDTSCEMVAALVYSACCPLLACYSAAKGCNQALIITNYTKTHAPQKIEMNDFPHNPFGAG
jgi:hypothetical protein